MNQRQANKEALRMAAAMVENADFDSLFGDDWQDIANEDILEKAQTKAVLRIRGLIGGDE